jgi:long-chain acyl-CoA synthetase
LKDGWLYTGDMVRVDKEGFVYIVDRKKDVIISGGENIYPVEIEDILHNHSDIFDVALIGISDERLGEVVCAVIQLKPGSTLTREEVLKYCEQNLPRYKRPKLVVFDAVMRNPTGKLEKPKMRVKYKSLVNK